MCLDKIHGHRTLRKPLRCYKAVEEYHGHHTTPYMNTRINLGLNSVQATELIEIDRRLYPTNMEMPVPEEAKASYTSGFHTYAKRSSCAAWGDYLPTAICEIPSGTTITVGTEGTGSQKRTVYVSPVLNILSFERVTSDA